MKNNEVIKKAQKFCLDNNIDTYPVRIIDICKKYGFSVYETQLPNNVCGFLVVQDEKFTGYDTNKIILVNPTDKASRRRFTIANELAHYYLHKLQNQTTYIHCCTGQNSSIEQESRIFAYNVLMPKKLVKEALDKLDAEFGRSLSDFEKVQRISALFAVSFDVAQIRLQQLHLIKKDWKFKKSEL